MVSLAIHMRSKLVGLRRTPSIILVFISTPGYFLCDSYHNVTCIFHAYSYDAYILVVRCMKQNKDAVWSLVGTTFSYWGAC